MTTDEIATTIAGVAQTATKKLNVILAEPWTVQFKTIKSIEPNDGGSVTLIVFDNGDTMAQKPDGWVLEQGGKKVARKVTRVEVPRLTEYHVQGRLGPRC